ncbi:MAG: hypothetical protein L0323_05490, partial [Planctomycetes bacterium]|nr:hypothetical protein [Planctomycetota bacterium]
MTSTLLRLLLATPANAQEGVVSVDPVFFEDRIAPLVRSTCATSGCHGGASGAGNLRYEQAGFGGEFTVEQQRANLAASLALVRPGRPEESLLYRKSIAESDGGLPHGGRSYALARDSEEAKALAAWIRGERLAGIAPIAEATGPASAPPGSRVRLDGSGSRDRRGAPLSFLWSVASAPEGSSARVEDAEKPLASFVPDRPGIYDLLLTVRNGETDASAHLPLSVERPPFVRLEAEEGTLAAPFERVPDGSASGGAFLSVSSGKTGRAEWGFELAEEGEYDLWIRSRAGQGAALAFSIDGAAPTRWEVLPAEGWIFSPVASGASGGAARRKVVSGRWEQRDGTLVGSATRGRPAQLDLDARIPEGSIEIVARPDSPDGGALVQIGSPDRRVKACAGFESGKAIVAAGLGERRRILGEAPAPRREPGEPLSFRVAVERGRIRVFAEDRLLLEQDLPARPGEGMGPQRRGAPPPPPGIALLVPSGTTRFEKVTVRRRGEVVYEDRFEGSGRGLRLKPGPHRLALLAEGGSAALDEILL